MSPIVNGKWYPTVAEGYADSPFFRGEVTHCVHGQKLGECDTCKRYIAAYEAEQKARWDRWDAYRALPWWKRMFTTPPPTP